MTGISGCAVPFFCRLLPISLIGYLCEGIENSVFVTISKHGEQNVQTVDHWV